MELASKYNPEEVEGNGTNIGWTTIFSVLNQMDESPTR